MKQKLILYAIDRDSRQKATQIEQHTSCRSVSNNLLQFNYHCKRHKTGQLYAFVRLNFFNNRPQQLNLMNGARLPNNQLHAHVCMHTASNLYAQCLLLETAWSAWLTCWHGYAHSTHDADEISWRRRNKIFSVCRKIIVLNIIIWPTDTQARTHNTRTQRTNCCSKWII